MKIMRQRDRIVGVGETRWAKSPEAFMEREKTRWVGAGTGGERKDEELGAREFDLCALVPKAIVNQAH